jgi:hypothetical protein
VVGCCVRHVAMHDDVVFRRQQAEVEVFGNDDSSQVTG